MSGMTEKNEIRDFGLIVGCVFCLIGLWPMIRHGESLRLWAIVSGALLIVLGLAAPSILSPFFKIWMKAGHAMGWINTRVILGILYFWLITPMGVVMRLFGWDSMRRTPNPDAESYRVLRRARPPSHMKRLF